MRSSLVFILLPLALAGKVAKRSPLLTSRQSSDCYSTEKVCGDYCILRSYTCCPDQSGGCPSYSFCDKGDNGEYGCCPEGETCSGDGGVETNYGGIPDVTIPSFTYSSYTFEGGNDFTTSADDFEPTTSFDDFSFTSDSDSQTTAAAGGLPTDSRPTAAATTEASSSSSSSSSSDSPEPTSTLRSGGGDSGDSGDSSSSSNPVQANEASNKVAMMGVVLAACVVGMFML